MATVEDMKANIGEELAAGEWLEVTQERINTFADATNDHQWIHVDEERAKTGPFGAPIAHGYLTLSLIPSLGGGSLGLDGVRMGINYGLDRVRFPAPVRSGSRIRAHYHLKKLDKHADFAQLHWQVTVEVQNQPKPALAADWLLRLYLTSTA